jgi:hypothetical protein
MCPLKLFLETYFTELLNDEDCNAVVKLDGDQENAQQTLVR